MASSLWTKTWYYVCLFYVLFINIKVIEPQPRNILREKLIWDCRINKHWLKKDRVSFGTFMEFKWSRKNDFWLNSLQKYLELRLIKMKSKVHGRKEEVCCQKKFINEV